MIFKCEKCNIYTLKEKCKICGMKTIDPHPPKFSIIKEKRYGRYRRKAKV